MLGGGGGLGTHLVIEPMHRRLVYRKTGRAFSGSAASSIIRGDGPLEAGRDSFASAQTDS